MLFLAKKSLGQNFLKSQRALEAATEAVGLKAGDTVLEIGPGYGALTEHLLETGAHVVAVEKDANLFAFLSDKYSLEIKSKHFVLVYKDILDLSAHEQKSLGLKKGAYKIVANIPYNITGQIIRQFLTGENQPNKMALLVQKEVADRIVGRDPHGRSNNKESLLSISVKVYGVPKIIMRVGKEQFSPQPKVDSAIILIDNISRDFFTDNKISEEKFWTIIHAAFAHKRKTVTGNLKGLVESERLLAELEEQKISPTVRAEDISIEEWGKLISAI